MGLDIKYREGAKYLSEYLPEINESVNAYKSIPNFILAPMGSGKSKLITDMAQNNSSPNHRVLILGPYRDNKKAYTEYGYYMHNAPGYEPKSAYARRAKEIKKNDKEGGKKSPYIYFAYGTKLLADMMGDELKSFYSSQELLAYIQEKATKFAAQVAEYVKEIIIDEYHFLKIQVMSEGTSKWFSSKNLTVNVSPDILLMIMLQALAKVIPVTGFSATDSGYSDESMEFTKFEYSVTLVDIPSSVTFASWTNIMVNNKLAKNQLFESVIRDNDNRKILIQANKFNYSELEILKNSGKTVVVKMLTNKHGLKANKNGVVQTEMQALGYKHLESLEDIEQGNAYYYTIDMQKDGDLEQMFDLVDIIAVNTSNSRTVSILNTYETNPLVINLETAITSNTIQTPGRFRLQPVDVVTIIMDKSFTKDNLVASATRLGKAIYKFSPNQHTYLKGVAMEYTEYAYITPLNKITVKQVASALGKSLSQETRKKRQALIDYFNTY